ncbi:13084_t:CDS:1 [Acaulospora colombiana]|uniref:13084_t:CDS:1 n=1 Tax=Acaulospora colombiana TaxID=27376 RepID=A0ACA9LLY1_9GLOM|nr:13084_t:CDS:1 [Acaulospora colombiana]
MTATKPKSSSQQCASPSQNDPLKRTNSNGSNSMTKKTRGPINKRACQRCRQGKIKCDGDAELGKPCSNCDPQNCKYDNAPRKNKQVEQLKQRMAILEEQLVSIVKELNEKLSTKDLEMEILCQLCESKELFNGSEVFSRLKNAIKNDKLPKQLLLFTRELLQRMSKNHEKIPDIIESLQRVVECAEYDKDPAVISNIPTVDQYRNVNGQYELVPPPYDPSILLADAMIIADNSVNLSSSYDACEGMTCPNSHSPSDDGSETMSVGFGSGSPPTPNEQHSLDDDSESYNNNSSRTSSTHQVSASPMSGFYYNTNSYYPSDYIDYNGTSYYFEATNTTSPTDSFLL